jgi:Fic family protein
LAVQTFRDLDHHLGSIPGSFGLSLGAIDGARGKEELFRSQRVATLDQLSKIARIQSVEASNAIEGIHAPLRRIQALAADKTTPTNRSEQEIAGYRTVLDEIHQSASHIPLTTNVVRQFHRDLLSFTPTRGGMWKTTANEVTETDEHGVRHVRFTPVGVFETPPAMAELHDRFSEEIRAQRHHALLLIGAYILDFTIIHPFLDGNGRMSRLLTLLALYQSGYGVGRYISLERIIDSTRDTYHESLKASTDGWHEGEHDVMPWLNYFLGTVLSAYSQFEERADSLSGRGSKEEAVRDFVESSVSNVFSLGDVRDAMPGVSDAYIRRILQAMRAEGRLTSTGAGRGAKWHKSRPQEAPALTTSDAPPA